MRALSEHLGAPIDREWSRYRHVTDTGIAAEAFERRHGRPPRPDEMTRVRERFLSLLRKASEPIREVPGAAELFRHLRTREDVLVAIATGGWRESALWKLQAAGIPASDVPIATADDATSREEILDLAMRRAGGPFAGRTYIGDGTWDVVAARALGIGFLGIACEREPETLVAAGAARVFPDLRDAAALLRAAGVGNRGGPRGPGH